jgi:hypothetical protein
MYTCSKCGLLKKGHLCRFDGEGGALSAAKGGGRVQRTQAEAEYFNDTQQKMLRLVAPVLATPSVASPPAKSAGGEERKVDGCDGEWQACTPLDTCRPCCLRGLPSAALRSAGGLVIAASSAPSAPGLTRIMGKEAASDVEGQAEERLETTIQMGPPAGRGVYTCSKCGLLKKGHTCRFDVEGGALACSRVAGKGFRSRGNS